MTTNRPLRFIIDTGANMSIINENLCEPSMKEKIKPVQIRTLQNTCYSNTRVKIPSFKIFQSDKIMEFLELKFHKFYDGLIGNNILMPFKANIDYNSCSLVLNNGVKMPLFFNQIHENSTKKYETLSNEIPIGEERNASINPVSEVRINHLNEEEKLKLTKIVKKYREIFYKDGCDLTFTNTIKHEIKTTDTMPIYTKTYRYPQIHKEEVDRQIQDMLKQGIIRPSKSPYSSPLWVVSKKIDASGKQKWRLVIDYRKLNEVTINDKFPIPNIDDILDKLGRSMYFTTIDLAKGFHQIEIFENDIPKTAFSTNQGHYEFLRMPFGLKNAPSTFQRMMNSILSELIGKICFVYLDDIIIFSTSIEEHLISIERVFRKLQEANLKVQLDKCEFMRKEIEYLGHVVTSEGVKPNPNKIKAIKQFPVPKTTKQIKQFLGLVGYYRKFIKDFAHIAKPMTTQLKKGNRINPSDKDYLSAFNKLKSLIISESILSYPDYNKKFVLTTDASNYAIGAVLSQHCQPISFASRTLNEHEVKYSTIEKELLAIVWATKYFRPYLYGREFTVKTDHKPLQWLANIKEPNSKLQRWKLRLEEYNFNVEYTKGKENYVADALSRVEINLNEDNFSTDATIHSAEEDNRNYIQISELPLNLFKTQIIVKRGETNKTEFRNIFNKKRIIITSNEPGEKLYENILRNHLPKKGIVGIMFDDMRMFIEFQDTYIKWKIPEINIKVNKVNYVLEDVTNRSELKEAILQEHFKNNHRGINEVYLEIKSTLYYPNLKREITQVINNCYICSIAKYERKPLKLPFRITETPSFKNEIIHMDIWFLKKGKPYLTFIDKLSKYAQVIPIKSRNWLDIEKGIKQYIGIIGKPKRIITDNERSFGSINCKSYFENNNIELHLTTPQLHTGNSDIERFHNTLNEHIRIIKTREKLEHGIKDEVDYVIETLLYYNNTIHSSTGYKPINFQDGTLSAEDIGEI